ncbi:hypothetical protein SO802_022154 [Lithocarpus litseifolius]|uniref:Uncharacterized protein n=1 Tax=Lithocarpus litseifolius TaxID=425828 RepID=A0AAW2CIB5_9ROSI
MQSDLSEPNPPLLLGGKSEEGGDRNLRPEKILHGLEYDIFQCLEGNFELHSRVVVLGSDDKGRGGGTFHYKENIGAKGEAMAQNKMDPKDLLSHASNRLLQATNFCVDAKGKGDGGEEDESRGGSASVERDVGGGGEEKGKGGGVAEVTGAHGSAENEFHGEDEVGGGNEGRGQDNLEGGRGENNPRQLVLYSRLTKMSITVFAQTTAAVIALQFSGDRISILIAVVLCNKADYICCSSAIVLRSWRPDIACILGRIGSLAAELGCRCFKAPILLDYTIPLEFVGNSRTRVELAFCLQYYVEGV